MTDDGGRSPLGALLLAVGRLRADAETAAEIARLLRIGDVAAAPIVPPALEPPPEPTPEPASRPSASPPTSGQSTELPPVLRDRVPTSSGELRVFRRQGPTARPAIAPPSLREPRSFRAEHLPFEPLLRPLGTRAIVGASITTVRPGDGLDVDRVVERIARRRPLEPLPWRHQAAVPAAVLVIVDRGPGMMPFAQDAEDLVARIASVAGRDRTRVVRVYQSPRVRPSGRPAAFALPPRGTTVVALTDAGIAPVEERVPRLLDHWIAFADELRTGGCRLIAFVPYPPARWPRQLVAVMTLLPWDRTTDLALVLRVLGRAGGRAWTR